jgi:hypothetical protein
MSWPNAGRPSGLMSEPTYCVEWNSLVTRVSSRQVGTLKWSLSLCVTSTASNRGTSAAAIGKSINTGMSKPPSNGSTISVVPRLLIRNPAIPSQRRTVPSVDSNAVGTERLGTRGPRLTHHDWDPTDVPS